VDPELVVAAQGGDRDAFAILARASGDRLFGIARRILRDHERAEDAVQNALVIAWRELPRLRDPDRFEAWLTRLLVNDCYEDYRRTRRHDAHVRTLPVDGHAGRDRADAAFRDDLISSVWHHHPGRHRPVARDTHCQNFIKCRAPNS